MTSPGLSAADTTPRRWGLPRGLIVMLGGAAMVIIIAGVQGVAWLIGPAFMALIVVIAVSPAQGWLRRKGWPTWATTLVVVLLVYAILIGFALGMILSIAQLGTQLPLYAAKADGLVTSLTAEFSKLGVAPDQLRQAAGSLDLGKLAGLIGGLLASVAGLASNLVFLLSLLLFLSIEAGASGERLAAIAADRLLAKAVLVDVDPHAGWADALLRASATKPEPPAAEATTEASGRTPTPSSPPLCHRRRWRSLAHRAASRRPMSHEF